jgi:hypothetical protein
VLAVMSAIFLSYAREDAGTAGQLAKVFQDRGWFVWWDRQIAPGRTFDGAIAEALESARCVVVLWSKHSVTSDWVREEAFEGAQGGILVPVTPGDVAVPLGFRRIQAARLPAGTLSAKHVEIVRLLAAVAPLVDRAPRALESEIGAVHGRGGVSREAGPLRDATSLVFAVAFLFPLAVPAWFATGAVVDMTLHSQIGDSVPVFLKGRSGEPGLLQVVSGTIAAVFAARWVWPRIR